MSNPSVPICLRTLHADISYHLEQIEKLFKGKPKITLVVRNSDSPTHEKDVLMGNDSAEGAISAIRELTANPAYVLPPYSEVKP
jgi:hypothetical protein